MPDRSEQPYRPRSPPAMTTLPAISGRIARAKGRVTAWLAGPNRLLVLAAGAVGLCSWCLRLHGRCSPLSVAMQPPGNCANCPPVPKTSRSTESLRSRRFQPTTPASATCMSPSSRSRGHCPSVRLRRLGPGPRPRHTMSRYRSVRGWRRCCGQAAVAQVVLNRVRHPAFPGTVCGVVYQGSQRKTGCQFTFTCDGSLTRRTMSQSAWQRARAIAANTLSGNVNSTVGLATHYHTNWVYPYWSPEPAQAGAGWHAPVLRLARGRRGGPGRFRQALQGQ